MDHNEEVKQPGDCLREELRGIEVAVPPNLSELLYTANETGLLTAVDEDEAISIYKIILLAQSYGSRPINHLRM